jgi:hypothetical protein
MAGDFDARESATKITDLAEKAAFNGLVVGNTPAIEALSCEMQKLQPNQLKAVLDDMTAGGKFSDIDEFYGDNNKTNAVAFSKKDGSGVVALLTIDGCDGKK